ncbi:MAG: thioredoxin [Hungatella sp.]
MAIVLTSANFEQEVLKSEIPVLVDFYADWCGPCKMMGPVVEELATEFKGKAKVGKLNIDQSEDIAARYGVMSIPTFLVIKNGVAAAPLVGARDKRDLVAAIEKAL